jgi:hypothetical protein
MELISILLIMYAFKKAWEDAKNGYSKSKAAYTASADQRYPNAPKSKRVALAAGHDIGYWTGQLAHGFPVARHGLSAGWNAGRQAQEQSKAARQRAKQPIKEDPRWRRAPGTSHTYTFVRPGSVDNTDGPAPAQHKADSGEGRTFPVILTARSKSGRKVNPLTGESFDRATVYDPEDLQRRLAAASADPDLEVSVRPAPPLEPGPPADEHAGQHASCNAPGCGCPCHATAAKPEDKPAGTETAAPVQSPSPRGEAMPTGTADVTYDGVLRNMTAAKAQAENTAVESAAASQQAEARANEAASASRTAAQLADAMDGLEVDPGTQSAMVDHLDAHAAAAKAHQAVQEASEIAVKADQRVLESAGNVEATLKRGHAGLSEAHKNAPVQAAAKPFYQE